MICPSCKKEVADKLSICPHCGSIVNKNKIQKKSVRTSKSVKSKIKIQDEASLVGGVVSKESFIKLSKNNKKKDIERKNFNNYIDYKNAKEKEELKNSKISTSSRSLIKSIETEESLQKVNASNRAKKAIAIKKKDNIKKEANEIVGAFNKKQKLNQEQIYSSKDVYKEKEAEQIVLSSKKENVNTEARYFNNPGDVARTKKHISFINISFENSNLPLKEQRKKEGIKAFNFFAYVVVICLWLVAVGTILRSTNEDYYFGENNSSSYMNQNNINQSLLDYNGVSKSGQKGGSSSEGVTSIVYDNQYLKMMNFSSESDVKNLIAADSIKQKDNCPANIIKIENEIISNYGITAVNLCEIEEELAIELRDVIKTIYYNYPSARNYLTNITIANVEQSYIAAFMPAFNFGTSNTNNGFPAAIKTQIILNAESFLNTNKLKNEVERSSKTGYFPTNATRSSTVAHEFGHYLSFVALLNHYNTKQLNFIRLSQHSVFLDVIEDFDNGTFSYSLLTEAYNEYKNEYPGTSFENFRKSISRYAMAKDSKGAYIYDETIAEAFHDIYINGDNAKPASKYIMKVLEEKL